MICFSWQEKIPLSKSPLESTWLYHEIGRCYLELNKYSDARDYGEKSLQAAKESDDDGWQLHARVLVAQAEGRSNILILLFACWVIFHVFVVHEILILIEFATTHM